MLLLALNRLCHPAACMCAVNAWNEWQFEFQFQFQWVWMVPFVVIFRCILLINLKPTLNSLTSFAPSRQYKHSTDRKLLVIIFKSFKIYLCELTTFNLFFSFLLFLSLSIVSVVLRTIATIRHFQRGNTHEHTHVRNCVWETEAVRKPECDREYEQREARVKQTTESTVHRRVLVTQEKIEGANERASEWGNTLRHTHRHIYQPKQHSQPREPFRTYVTFKVTTTQQQQQPIATHTQIHSLSLARVIGWKEKWT